MGLLINLYTWQQSQAHKIGTRGRLQHTGVETSQKTKRQLYMIYIDGAACGKYIRKKWVLLHKELCMTHMVLLSL